MNLRVGLDVDELDLGRVAEHGGGDHPAEVGVEADVLAGLVEDVEPGEVVAHTTAHDVVGDHRVEDRISRLHLVEHTGSFRVVAAVVVVIVAADDAPTRASTATGASTRMIDRFMHVPLLDWVADAA